MMFTNINYPSKIDIHKYQLSVKRYFSHMNFYQKLKFTKLIQNPYPIPVKSL